MRLAPMASRMESPTKYPREMLGMATMPMRTSFSMRRGDISQLPMCSMR